MNFNIFVMNCLFLATLQTSLIFSSDSDITPIAPTAIRHCTKKSSSRMKNIEKIVAELTHKVAEQEHTIAVSAELIRDLQKKLNKKTSDITNLQWRITDANAHVQELRGNYQALAQQNEALAQQNQVLVRESQESAQEINAARTNQLRTTVPQERPLSLKLLTSPLLKKRSKNFKFTNHYSSTAN